MLVTTNGWKGKGQLTSSIGSIQLSQFFYKEKHYFKYVFCQLVVTHNRSGHLAESSVLPELLLCVSDLLTLSSRAWNKKLAAKIFCLKSSKTFRHFLQAVPVGKLEKSSCTPSCVDVNQRLICATVGICWISQCPLPPSQQHQCSLANQ